ncbi:MAG: family hydrolase [Chloroflexi bacterium]|nr:family hydrolase [Chloroflexota bacterium]
MTDGPIAGVIFDVDGVLVDSPHERAWRESLRDLLATDWRGIDGAERVLATGLTTVIYQDHVAGKPRLSGARAVLDYFQLPSPDSRAPEYAACKQRRLVELIDDGQFSAFGDGLRFVLALKERGLKLAAASSSENANGLMAQIRIGPSPEAAGRRDAGAQGLALLDMFDANVCGRPVAQGKPHPDLFLLAAQELGLPPGVCLVVEDALSGVQAAQAGGMRALGVARLRDEALLNAAGADLVVSTLNAVWLDGIPQGRLERLLPPDIDAKV